MTDKEYRDFLAALASKYKGLLKIIKEEQNR
jgi:hypothetical protein